MPRSCSTFRMRLMNQQVEQHAGRSCSDAPWLERLTPVGGRTLAGGLGDTPVLLPRAAHHGDLFDPTGTRPRAHRTAAPESARRRVDRRFCTPAGVGHLVGPGPGPAPENLVRS